MKFWFGKKETETDAVPEKAEAATVFSTSAESVGGAQPVAPAAPSHAATTPSATSVAPAAPAFSAGGMASRPARKRASRILMPAFRMVAVRARSALAQRDG